jgi:HK97 family phage major capsid protein
VVALGKEIDRLERQLEIDMELAKAVNQPIRTKPNAGTETKTGRASDEYKEAFWKALRNKHSYDVQNALQIGTDSEGGYLVPDDFERTLIESLEQENIIRTLAHVVTTSFGDKKIPVVASKGTAAWTDEEAAMHESDDAFGSVTLGAHKLSTMIKVSEELLSDSVFNLEAYIAKEFARRTGSAEEEAFITGDGTGKPTGFLVTGEVGVTTAGNAISMDEVIDFYHSLKEPYRKNAIFITNDATIKAIRKLKDGNGQYLWQPSVQAGQPDTILNRPLKTSGYVPAIAAGAKVLAFGDFSYYWIADRQGRSFQRLNELYAANGQVGFRATQRVDGKLILPEAVKVLQMKA